MTRTRYPRPVTPRRRQVRVRRKPRMRMPAWALIALSGMAGSSVGLMIVVASLGVG